MAYVGDNRTIWDNVLTQCYNLQVGAHIYVCGDALRMAGDVHTALLKVIANEGDLSSQEAEAYMNKLEEASRYQRDVWVT